jgi:GAF domain-containing protein
MAIIPPDGAIVAVADGLGSADLGARGAELACLYAVRGVRSLFYRGEGDLSPTEIVAPSAAEAPAKATPEADPVIKTEVGLMQKAGVDLDKVGADRAPEISPRMREAARKEGIVSVLCVLLSVRDKPIGVLRLYTGEMHRFTDEEIDFLSTLPVRPRWPSKMPVCSPKPGSLG